jgi:hypothetical protein
MLKKMSVRRRAISGAAVGAAVCVLAWPCSAFAQTPHDATQVDDASLQTTANAPPQMTVGALLSPESLPADGMEMPVDLTVAVGHADRGQQVRLEIEIPREIRFLPGSLTHAGSTLADPAVRPTERGSVLIINVEDVPGHGLSRTFEMRLIVVAEPATHAVEVGLVPDEGAVTAAVSQIVVLEVVQPAAVASVPTRKPEAPETSSRARPANPSLSAGLDDDSSRFDFRDPAWTTEIGFGLDGFSLTTLYRAGTWLAGAELADVAHRRIRGAEAEGSLIAAIGGFALRLNPGLRLEVLGQLGAFRYGRYECRGPEQSGFCAEVLETTLALGAIPRLLWSTRPPGPTWGFAPLFLRVVPAIKHRHPGHSGDPDPFFIGCQIFVGFGL